MEEWMEETISIPSHCLQKEEVSGNPATDKLLLLWAIKCCKHVVICFHDNSCNL